MGAISRYIIGSSVVFAVSALSLPPSPAAAQTNTGCSAAAAHANDNPFLRRWNYIGTENRESARVHVYLASRAAAGGNESECWHQLQVSGLFVALPPGTMPQGSIAQAHVAEGGVARSAMPDPAVPGSGYRIPEVHR